MKLPPSPVGLAVVANTPFGPSIEAMRALPHFRVRVRAADENAAAISGSKAECPIARAGGVGGGVPGYY